MRLRCIAAVLGILIGLLFGEFFARVGLTDYDAVVPAVFVASPIIPYTPRPGAVQLGIRHPQGDYIYDIHVGDDGYRLNGPQPEPREPATYLLGDSFAWGHGLSDNATVAAQIESTSASQGAPVRVVNAGYASGFNPATAAAWWHTVRGSIRATAIIHLIFPFNDVDDVQQSRVHQGTDGLIDRVEYDPVYVDDTGRIRLADRAGLRPARDWLRSHVRLYYAVFMFLSERLMPTAFASSRTDVIPRVDAFALTVDAMSQVQRTAAKLGIPYVAVFVPTVHEVSAGQWQESGATLMAMANSRQIEVIDLLSAKPPLDPSQYFAHDEHWNARGAATVAQQILHHIHR